MKKLVLFALIAVGTMACRNNDNDEPTVKNDLEGAFPVGAWKYVKNAYLSGADGSIIGATDLGCGKGARVFKIYNGNKIERFNTDAKCVDIASGAISGTYTYDATSKTIRAVWGPNNVSTYPVLRQDANGFIAKSSAPDTDSDGDGKMDKSIYVFEKY